MMVCRRPWRLPVNRGMRSALVRRTAVTARRKVHVLPATLASIPLAGMTTMTRTAVTAQPLSTVPLSTVPLSTMTVPGPPTAPGGGKRTSLQAARFAFAPATPALAP
ncbi:hypothetical protein J2858_000803 [Neorhizobium galegae]|uniref:hypothetical protein n=1 Tax=Neorhizobium galegae TaxID=399 RepID=UPI001AE489E7|nr:hypothetical protein [Neorhizobium galegae]MBP2547910.1 hypothetical protein [Neorhizobium galegae]